MIPVFAAAGGRVVAPDFFGFGRSDKPVEQEVYSFDFHRDYLLRLVEHLDLTGITLVVQDWGGLLGLTLPMDLGFAPRLSRLLAMNTGLAVGDSPGQDFEDWRAYAAAHPDLPVGALLKRSVPALSDAEAAAYDAPFPDVSYKAGVRAFPQLVMTEPDMPGVEISLAAQQFWATWDGPSFLAAGAQDQVLGVPAMDRLHRIVRGSPAPLVLPDAGHFVQEHGELVARAALASFARAAGG